MSFIQTQTTVPSQLRQKQSNGNFAPLQLSDEEKILIYKQGFEAGYSRAYEEFAIDAPIIAKYKKIIKESIEKED